MDDGWHKPLNEEALDDHGVIHCNGYGHLVCLNGIEGGSKFPSEREIMDLWDKICTNLRARYIAVENDDGERMVACDICEVWQHTRFIEMETVMIYISVFYLRS